MRKRIKKRWNIVIDMQRLWNCVMYYFMLLWQRKLFFLTIFRRAAIHAEAPEFVEMSTEQEILVTGIKVVDLLAPYAKGGKIGMINYLLYMMVLLWLFVVKVHVVKKSLKNVFLAIVLLIYMYFFVHPNCNSSFCGFIPADICLFDKIILINLWLTLPRIMYIFFPFSFSWQIYRSVWRSWCWKDCVDHGVD